MSMSTTSITPTLHGPWRLGAVPSATATASSSGHTASARAADSPDRPPLLQAMLATMTVTETDANGAASAAAQDGGPPAEAKASLQESVLGFSQALMQALRTDGSDGAPGQPGLSGQVRYGSAEALAPRIGALAQRIAAPAAETEPAEASADAAAAAAAAKPWPTQQAARRVLEAFTQLQRAMGKPIPEGAEARREALGEFLERLAQSFHSGADASDTAHGGLIHLRA